MRLFCPVTRRRRHTGTTQRWWAPSSLLWRSTPSASPPTGQLWRSGSSRRSFLVSQLILHTADKVNPWILDSNEWGVSCQRKLWALLPNLIFRSIDPRSPQSRQTSSGAFGKCFARVSLYKITFSSRYLGIYRLSIIRFCFQFTSCLSTSRSRLLTLTASEARTSGCWTWRTWWPSSAASTRQSRSVSK